jgi:hypothetical protein
MSGRENLRCIFIYLLIATYVTLGIIEISCKRYSTAGVSFLLSAVNGLIYFG